MSQSQPVPELDLAPKLRRPLSLWNPLNYVQLLYWAFCFVPVFWWYQNLITRNESDVAEVRGWRQKRLFRNPIRTKLFLQGCFLQIFAPSIICYLLAILGMPVSWSGLVFGMLGGIASNIAGTIAYGTAYGTAIGAVMSTIAGVAFSMASTPGSIAVGIIFAMVFIGAISAVIFTSINEPNSRAFTDALSVAFSSTIAVFFASIVINLGFGVTTGTDSNVFVGIVVILFVWIAVIVGADFGAVFGIIILATKDKPVRERRLKLQEYKRHNLLSIPRIASPFSFSSVTRHLGFCLQWNWRLGLRIADSLLRYTAQFVSVISAVNLALSRIQPEYLIAHVAVLADLPCEWDLLYYTSVSLNDNSQGQLVRKLSIFLPPFLQKRFLTGIHADLRLNSASRAAAAGFWYLYLGTPKQAAEAFKVVESLPNGAEMLLLATILDLAQVSQLIEIASLKIPFTPPNPLLRPATWQAINALRRASEDIRVVCNAASRTTRAFASNRALGDLSAILEAPESLYEAERDLILLIAQTWRESLLKVVGEIGRIEILKPVQNPYVTGDPVEGSLFVGRDDILKQLEELWFMSDQLQSVVLYGHRRMGKTSLLRNVNDRLGSNTQLIYVNLLNLGEVTQGAGEVLLSICDEIAQATNHPAPSDTDLINLPYPTFRRYLQSLIQSPDSKGLIIALDEFEKLEDLITTEKLSPDFLSYLRGLVQMSPKIAFAFAGLHTLEEMTEDYFSPFFASVIPIRLSFLDRASTRQLLANPSDDFPLDYAPDLYDEIFDLTAGQPYLVQLLGFQLVRRYNAQVFEQGRDRSHQFSIDDLTAITESSDLYDNGRYYFTGVWQQAAQSPPGQQDILKAIAHQGLSRDVLLQHFDPAQFDTAIEALRRHDVVHEVNQTWCIKVELFRRWVVKYAIENH